MSYIKNPCFLSFSKKKQPSAWWIKSRQRRKNDLFTNTNLPARVHSMTFWGRKQHGAQLWKKKDPAINILQGFSNVLLKRQTEQVRVLTVSVPVHLPRVEDKVEVRAVQPGPLLRRRVISLKIWHNRSSLKAVRKCFQVCYFIKRKIYIYILHSVAKTADITYALTRTFS